MTAAERWARLRDQLATAGYTMRLDEKPYHQLNYGRVEHGVSRQLFAWTEDGGSVTIREKYGRGGKWYGYEVSADDRDGYSRAIERLTTRRSAVVSQVAAYVTRYGALTTACRARR